MVIAFARKPAFFSHAEPFRQVFPPEEGEQPVTRLSRGKAYTGGNLTDFERMTGWKGDAVLYVGDHIYGDVLRSKKSAGWRTALILPELEEELGRIETAIPYLTERENLQRARQRFEDEISYQKRLLKKLEGESGGPAQSIVGVNRRLEILQEQVLDNAERMQVVNTRANRYFNPYWGRLFRSGTGQSSFGSQVARYACLYTGRVSNFLTYPPTHYFQRPEERMPHERWDYY